jgi:hypothetical protein
MIKPRWGFGSAQAFGRFFVVGGFTDLAGASATSSIESYSTGTSAREDPVTHKLLFRFSKTNQNRNFLSQLCALSVFSTNSRRHERTRWFCRVRIESSSPVAFRPAVSLAMLTCKDRARSIGALKNSKNHLARTVIDRCRAICRWANGS